MLIKKITSLITAILFFTQTAAYCSPLSIPAAPAQNNSNFQLSLELPQSLGKVEEIYTAPGNNATLIHIQDAHGSYEAQKHIRDILRTLTEQHAIKLVFLEGAQTALDPGLFHFFENPALNLKAADTLMRHGEFSGAEMFLLEQSFLKNKKTTASGHGIEQPDLYRHDLILFRKIMNESEIAAQSLADLRLKAQILEDAIFSKELKSFVDVWEKHQEDSEILHYAGFLANQAKKHLDLNLRDPANQTASPALTRMLQLKEVQTGLDSGKIEKEKSAILETLKDKLDAGSYESLKSLGSPASKESRANPRYLLEKIAEQAKDSTFSFTSYPHFSLFAACLIFEHEITSQQLFKEMDGLADRLFEVLPQTEAEKELLLLVRNLAVLKKLFALELSRGEYESILKTPYAFKPSLLIEKIREFVAGSHSKITPWTAAQESDADSRFEEALEFYRLARERENFFLEKALAQMKQTRETKAVLITGGFHTQGLQDIMKEKGISYALVSPKLADAKESRDHYLKAMLGKNDRPEAVIEESQIALFMRLLSQAAQQNLAEKSHIEARTRFAARVLWDLALQNGRASEIPRIAAKAPQYSPYLTAASLGGQSADLIMTSPHFPPIDIKNLAGEEVFFEEDIPYEPFLQRERRLSVPYMGHLRYARQTLDELVLNAMRAKKTILDHPHPTVRVTVHAYDDAIYRLTVDQPLGEPADTARLREIHAGFRAGGPDFLVSLKPRYDNPILSHQQNNGFFNVARFMQEAPVTLIYSTDLLRGILTTTLYFQLKRPAPAEASSLGIHPFNLTQEEWTNLEALLGTGQVPATRLETATLLTARQEAGAKSLLERVTRSRDIRVSLIEKIGQILGTQYQLFRKGIGSIDINQAGADKSLALLNFFEIFPEMTLGIYFGNEFFKTGEQLGNDLAALKAQSQIRQAGKQLILFSVDWHPENRTDEAKANTLWIGAGPEASKKVIAKILDALESGADTVEIRGEGMDSGKAPAVISLKELREKGFMGFDVDETILMKRTNTFATDSDIRLLFARMLKLQVKAGIFSGNAAAEQRGRILNPLKAELGEPSLSSIANFLLYANSGATRLRFDARGTETMFHLLGEIPAEDIRRVADLIIEAAKSDFGLYPDELELWKQWFEFDGQFGKRPDLPNVRYAPWWAQNSFAPDILQAGTLQSAKIATQVSEPYLEIRDGVQISVKLFPARLKFVTLPEGKSLGTESAGVQQTAAAVEGTVSKLLTAHGKSLSPEDFIRSPEAADFWRALHQFTMHKDLPGEKDIAASGLPAWTHDLWQLFILDDRLDFAMRVDMGGTSYQFIEQKILELILKINPQAAVLAPIAQRIPQPKKPREKTYTRRSTSGTTGGNEYFETWLGWQTIRTQDDEKLMEVMEYIKRGEDIPADKQRLLPRQVADRSQVRMFTADKASQNYTATGVEEGETVTPVIRKMKNGDYAIGFEAVSKLTRRPFIVASYVFVRGGQIMTGKPPKSNMEVNDVVPTESMPTTMSVFVREIIYWLSLGIIPAELAKIHEEDLTKLKELGLIQSGGSGLFADRKIIFWKNPAEKEIALSKVAGVEDPILKIHKDKNGTWIASLWARARKAKQGEGLPDKITRPELPLNDLILFAPDAKGFRVQEKEFPDKPVGFEHVEGEIPDASRTFRNALQARWYVYWLANGGDQIPDEEESTVKHGRDPYLFRFAEAVQQPLLGADFAKGKTVRSWVTFSKDKNIRGVRYQNIQGDRVVEKYFILYKGNQFQLPEEVSADQVELVATATTQETPAAAKDKGFVPFHSSLTKEQRFQIIQERRKIQQRILELDEELNETLALAETSGGKTDRLEQIQSEMESLLLLALDLEAIQTTGDFSGKEDLKQTLGFLWNVSFSKQELTGDTATRDRFTQALDRVIKGESSDWDFLNAVAAGAKPSETGDEFYGVTLPVDKREHYARLFPAAGTGPAAGLDGPWVPLGNYSKDNVVVTVSSEAKGKDGKTYLRVRIYDPARLDTPLNSYYFDPELNRFVDSKEEWKRWLAGISTLGVPGDMIAAALTEGGQVNIFNYFVRGTAGVNVAGDQETLAVTPDETAQADRQGLPDQAADGGLSELAPSGEQRIFGTINMGSALFEEKVHGGFFPFGTSGVGPILYFRAEEKDGKKIVTAYGSSNLTEHNAIESYPWIADDAALLAAKPTGLLGFGRGAEGPLKELAGYDYVPSRNESLRAWVNGEKSPLREFVDPDSIKQRGVPMPAPSADVANPSKLRVTEGTLGEDVTWRNTVESVFFGEQALDLYYRNNAFPAQRGFYSAEAPLGINSFLEAIRRFPRVAQLAAGTPKPAEPLLMHKPGSWKMGEGRFELLDGVRGKTGKKVGTNVFNNAFKDIEEMGFSTDHVWIEYGYITEGGRTLPVMYFISLDKEHKKATLALRVVEIADNYFRYDKYEGGQDVSSIVIPRAIERGYFRPVSAVVYPELLENRLRLIAREISIAARAKDGWDGLQLFAQTSLLDQLLEARRFGSQGENWAEIYFYLASQAFRAGLAQKAAEIHQLYTQTGSAAPADFLRDPKVAAFLAAFENNAEIKRYTEEEPWRLQPLRYLADQIAQFNASGTAGHSAEDLARITDQIAAGLVSLAQGLPVIAFQNIQPVPVKLRERPRKGERGQMMASRDALGEAEVTGQEAEGYVLPPAPASTLPAAQPVAPKPIRVPVVPSPRPVPTAGEPGTPAPVPVPPATPKPAPVKVVETAPTEAAAPATLGEHPVLTLWPKELTDADRFLFGELPTLKSRFRRVEKLADAVPAGFRVVQEKNQAGTLTYPAPDIIALENNFFGVYEAVDLPANQRAALTQSFQGLKAGLRAGRLNGTSPLPAFNVGLEWARFHHGSGKKDYAERARRRQALIWRPANYNWNKAREPFLQDARNKDEEEDFLSARVVTEMLERAVLEIQAKNPQIEYFWVEMAPAFGAGTKQHPALYLTGVDLKRKQASPVTRLIETRRDVFEKSASPENLDLSNQIFGFMAEHGYRLSQEEIRLEERVRSRLELVQKLHDSEKLVDDIDVLITEERKPLTDPQISELLARYFETDFITHLMESRKAAGDRTGTSILDFPFLLSSTRLKPLYEAAKAVSGAANLSQVSAALFLKQVMDNEELNAIFGYQRSLRHEIANILESRLENEAETTEAIRWTKILAQKILALSQSPYPVAYQITAKMPKPVTRKPKKEEAPEAEPEVVEPEPTTPAKPVAVETTPAPAIVEPSTETVSGPAVLTTTPQPAEITAPAVKPTEPAAEPTRFEKEIAEAKADPDHGWNLINGYFGEIDTLRAQEEAGQTNSEWNTELLIPHVIDLLGAVDTAAYRATLTLPDLRELQMLNSITSYYGALFFKQAGDETVAGQEWDSAVKHAEEALKTFDREPESETKNHQRGQEIIDWILALDAENAFLKERQKQQQSGILREIRQQYAAYNYGMRFDYQNEIEALEKQILDLAPSDSMVRKARDYRRIYYAIAELDRDLPELDMRGFRERAREIRENIRAFRDYRDNEAWVTLTAALIETDIHKLTDDVKHFRLVRIDASGVVDTDALTRAFQTEYFARVQTIQDFIAKQLPDSASSRKGELRMTLMETKNDYDTAAKELPAEVSRRQAELEQSKARRTPPPATPASGKPARRVERRPAETSWTETQPVERKKEKDKKQKDKREQPAPRPVVISDKLDAELSKRAQTALGTLQRKIENYDEDAKRRKMPEPLHMLRDMEHLLLHILALETVPAQASYDRFANAMVRNFMLKNKATTNIMDETYNIARAVLGTPNIDAQSLGSESQALDYSLKTGRSNPQAMIEIARDVTFKLYSLPGANVAVVNYYRNELGLTDQSVPPPVSKSVKALQTGQMNVRDILEFVNGKQAGNPKPLIVFVNEFLGEAGKELSKDEIASMAHTISGSMNPGDFFIGVVQGEQDRQLMGELYHEAADGRFRAKAVPHEILTEAAIAPLSKSLQAAPASISTLEHAGDESLELEELVRIRVNENILRQSGMDWSTAISILRQILDDPENLPKLQFRLDKDGYWEMGSGFLALMETVYNRMKAENRLAQAA